MHIIQDRERETTKHCAEHLIFMAFIYVFRQAIIALLKRIMSMTEENKNGLSLSNIQCKKMGTAKIL